MLCSDLQVVPYSAGTAYRAYQDAYRQIGAQQRVHDLRERDDAYERSRHAGHYPAGHKIVQTPLDQIGQAAAEYAQHQTFDDEGAADEAVRRADHLHNGYLLAPRERGQLYRVGHYEEGHDDQNDDENERHYAHDVPRRYESLCIIQVRVDLGDAVNVFEVLLRLAHEADIRQVDDISVPESGGVQDVEKLRVIVLLEVLHGLLVGDELHARHVRHGFHQRLERLGLFQRQHVVDKCDDLVFVLQAGEHIVYVHDQQTKAAHDDEASHDYRDRGKAHEPVAEYARDAGFYQISKSIHSCNTRPFRRL